MSDFWRRIWPSLPLVLLCGIVFYWELQKPEIVEAGYMSADMVIGHFQIYRLFTSMFLHAGFEHIGSNMLALLFYTTINVTFQKPWKYYVTSFAAGIVGGLLTCLVYTFTGNADAGAIGASGAIMGLLGSNIFLFIRYKEWVPTPVRVRYITILSFTALQNIIPHYEGVSYADHFCGLVVGILVTWLLNAKITWVDIS